MSKRKSIVTRSLLITLFVFSICNTSVAGFLEKGSSKHTLSVSHAPYFSVGCGGQYRNVNHRVNDARCGDNLLVGQGHWTINIFRIGRIDSNFMSSDFIRFDRVSSDLMSFNRPSSSRVSGKNESAPLARSITAKIVEKTSSRVVEPGIVVLLAIGLVGLWFQRRYQR